LGNNSQAWLPALLSLILCLNGPRDGGHPVHKLGAEEDVGVVKHPVLERDDDELGAPEVSLQHVADVLGVTQVQGRVHLV
jgi:hypothetical protein